MAAWIIAHSWKSFSQTEKYCGFLLSKERDKIKNDDIVVYYGQGIIFGVFKVIGSVEREFDGWDKVYPFQIKIAPILVSKNGLSAKVIQYRLHDQRMLGGSSNLMKISDIEFNQIKHSIEIGARELAL